MTTTKTKMTPLTAFHALGEKKWPCLIVVSGDNIAQRYILDRPETIVGRTDTVDIHINEANISRRHASITMVDGKMRLIDLGSTNGTYINSRRLVNDEVYILNDGDLIGLGTTVFKYSLQSEIDEAFFSEIVDSARYDVLTGLVNRKFFERHLIAEFARIKRYGGQLNLLMCDLDDFKAINDNHGHQAGDLVLSHIGKTILSCVRNNIDIPGRYGGEEIVIMLPEIAYTQAQIVAEKIRATVAEQVIRYHNHQLRVTISIGLSHIDTTTSSPEALITRADAELYKAKALGKNRIGS